MSTSDVLSKFQTYSYKAASEALGQNVAAFNEASNSAITLTSAANVGDYGNNAAFAAISDMIRRRDVYSNEAVESTSLEMLNARSVKVAGGTSPVTFSPAHFAWIQQNPEEAGVVIGEQLAEGMLQDQLNAAVLAVKAAISGNADAVHDGSAGKLSLEALLKGAAKMGDQAFSLAAWVIHSGPMHDLLASNVANTSNLFEFGTVRVVDDGFGRRLVMTDSPGLVDVEGGTPTYSTLGLVRGGVQVQDNGDLFSHIETQTGKENLERVFQAEYSFNLGVKGAGYAGTHSPNDATLGSAASWEQIASSVKQGAGVVVTSK